VISAEKYFKKKLLPCPQNLFFFKFQFEGECNLEVPHPTGCMPHVVSNERCKLVVYVIALGYLKILPQNLPGDIKENNYVTFLCFSYTSTKNIHNL
jgi:hypothetical protein